MSVASEEVLIEREGSALSALHIEVLQLGDSSLERGIIIELDDGTIEGLVKVSSDLRGLESVNTSNGLDEFSNLGAGDEVLGEIV